MTSSRWLDDLARRELRPGTWTLEVITELCLRLGDPQARFPAIHVAGSRGKGSTCALLESALSAGGLRAGMTTSPHLLSPRERIRIEGADVDDATFADLVGRVRAAGAEELAAGYFEVMTAAAFLAFAEARVDVAVVETGLGGRVDATNVVRPLVTVVTHLGLDHADRLGGTAESIAREKAGILKPGVRAVLAPNETRVARVVETRASRIGAPLRKVSQSDVERAPLPSLPGARQRENAAVAQAALEELGAADARLTVSSVAVARGFASARWPARLDLRRGALDGADLLLDVAHDVDGARALVDHLAAPPAAVIFSCLADKDLAGIAAQLARPIVREAIVLVPGLPGPRARPAADVARSLADSGLCARAVADVEAALREASRIAGRGGLVVAFGSFLIAGRVLELLPRP